MARRDGRVRRSRPQIKALVYFDADRSDADAKSYDMSLRNAPGSMAVVQRARRDPYFDWARRGAAVGPRRESGGPVVVPVLSHRDPPLVRRLVSSACWRASDTVALLHHDPRGPGARPARGRPRARRARPAALRLGAAALARAVLAVVEVAAARGARAVVVLLVSGQDYPARPLREVVAELRVAPADAYLRWFRVDADPARDVHPWQAGRRRRYLHRRPAARHAPLGAVPARSPFRGDGTARRRHVGQPRRRAAPTWSSSAAGWPRSSATCCAAPIPDEALLPTLLLNDAGGLTRARQPAVDPVDRGRRAPRPVSTSRTGRRSARPARFFARKVDAAHRALLDLLDEPDA